ncbi:hypothetical protein J4423_00665 [Candidatus Pacearchaeota archaeon]|nr:hypothetical protein [Candidatus Pacearchaeota archaeon]
MDRKTFWLLISIVVLIVAIGAYLLYIRFSSDVVQVTGSTVMIVTNQGTYTLQPGTTITIDDNGDWVVSESVEIPTSRGVIVIGPGTRLVIIPEPEPNYPSDDGS